MIRAYRPRPRLRCPGTGGGEEALRPRVGRRDRDDPPADPPEFLDGPFLLSTASDANGTISFNFTLTGLASGDRVILNLEAAGNEPADFPAPEVNFPQPPGIGRWSLPDTPSGARSLEWVIP